MFDRRGFIGKIIAGVTGSELAADILKAEPREPFNPPAPPADQELRQMLSGLVDRGTNTVYDRIRFLVYDRIRFPFAEPPISGLDFFRTPIGQRCPYSGIRKSFADTNMSASSMFIDRAPHDLIVKRIGFILVSEEFQGQLNEKANFSFSILDKTFREAPLLMRDGVAFFDFERDYFKYIPPFAPFALHVDLGRLSPIVRDVVEELDLIVTLTGLSDRSVQ